MNARFALQVIGITGVLLACANRNAEGQPPSFDCRLASTATEKAICASAELSDLDSQLGRVFSDVIAATKPDRLKAVRSRQRAWIAEREHVCNGQAPCLAEYLKNRIAALKRGDTGADDAEAAIGQAPGGQQQPLATPAPAPGTPAQPTANVQQPNDGIQWDPSPRCSTYKTQHYALRAAVDGGNMLEARHLVDVDASAEFAGCKHQGATVAASGAAASPTPQPKTWINAPDGTRWDAASRCAVYKKSHETLRSRVDGGDIFAARDLTHIDVEAELAGCKAQGQ